MQRQPLLDDLRRVLRFYGRPFTRREYRKVGKFASCTYENNFGSWNLALNAAGIKKEASKKIDIKKMLDEVNRPLFKKREGGNSQPVLAGPKVLVLDIETAPILAHVWTLWENNVGLNQIERDWHVMSWSAKWLDDPAGDIMYMDQRHEKDMEDDSRILREIWKLLDQADIVITHNGKSFDIKKLNARFILKRMTPPSSFRNIDTKVLAKRRFNFTSNKLEYLTDKLCTKYKKLRHTNFVGHDLWRECLARNIDAWNEMEEYNKHDVLSLEELYHVMKAWDDSINFNVYHDEPVNICRCGSRDLVKNGFHYTASGKFQKYQCKKCGAESRDRNNLLSTAKKASLHGFISR